LWRLGSGATSEVVSLPTDLYIVILNTACALAQDESKNANGSKRVPSLGADDLQKSLVLATSTQKIYIIR
jgi:hypothetical protein